MMNAVESLRRRVAPGAVARSLGYAPLSFSDDGEDTVDDVGGGYELGGIRGEYSGEVGEVGVRRQARRRHDDDLRPHYTPLYLNVKVQRRKVLDASSAERRIGPCVKVCLAISLFGCLFLSWIGFTLAGGSPYMLEKESVETKLAVSRSVFGGAAMYFVCACLAGFCWYRISFGPRVMPTLGHVSRVGSSSISSNLHFSSSVSLQ